MARQFRELLGLPCSGKTHYLDNHECTPYFVDRISKAKRIYNAMLNFIKLYKISIITLKTFRHVKLKLWLLHLIGITRFYSRLYEMEKMSRSNTLAEEGVLQALWGFCFLLNINSKSRQLTQDIYINIPDRLKGDVCYVSVNKFILFNRNKERAKKTRFSNLISDGLDSDYYYRGRYWMKFILILTRKDSSLKVSFYQGVK
ncbi:hypothetical protein VCR14J2_270190 [Vibrio coralliirubri]|uniref:hypothetical protein n=1 Tax=Vibrio coralliirubri TaxID=1516159 RepID=UPI00063096DA|nr:hypothetical protein [Vibrio coralliirubri]CDT99989.1 hypothetical protein VCR14J2_270190 [Vibrio coralliirubri]